MMRDFLSRFGFVLTLALLYALMGYCGLVMIELAFRELSKS